MPASESNRSRDRSRDAPAHLVCPRCYREYVPADLPADVPEPRCPQCGLPLIRAKRNRRKLKCLDCVHRAVVPQGIWCTHFNEPATPELADSCRKYAKRSRRRS